MKVPIQKLTAGVAFAGLVLLLLFGWFVWPSKYRYDTMGTARVPIRTNRFNGDAERLTDQGWMKLRPASVAEDDSDLHSRPLWPQSGNTTLEGARPLEELGFRPLGSNAPITPSENARAQEDTLPTRPSRASKITFHTLCPPGVPAGTKVEFLDTDDLARLEGSDAKVRRSDDVDDYGLWNISFTVTNRTNRCVTSIGYEAMIETGRGPWKGKGEFTFDEPLAPGAHIKTGAGYLKGDMNALPTTGTLMDWDILYARGFPAAEQ